MYCVWVVHWRILNVIVFYFIDSSSFSLIRVTFDVLYCVAWRARYSAVFDDCVNWCRGLQLPALRHVGAYLDHGEVSDVYITDIVLCLRFICLFYLLFVDMILKM